MLTVQCRLTGTVYTKCTNTKKDVLPLGCWAHARRKFEESLKNDRERAEYALEQIGLLYEVEREADDKNLSYNTTMTSITG